MKENPKQTPVSQNAQQEGTYTNALFNTFTLDDLDEKHFPLFKKDLEDILSDLAEYMKDLLEQFTLDTKKNKDKCKDKCDEIMSHIHKKCNLLKEYCMFFAKHKWKISLSYEYFWVIVHKWKSYGEGIDRLLNIYRRSKDPKDFKNVKGLIKDGRKDIINKKDRIPNMEFKEQPFYEEILFSPLWTTQKIINSRLCLIQPKNLHVINTIPDNHSISSNKQVFEIVIDNLLTNAIKFTPNWGKITIGIEDETDTSIKFFVQDSWIGIPSGVNPFKRWYTTPWVDGQSWTGLGLDQSKIFLKVIRWALWYHDAPGWGTIFSFELQKTP